MGLNIPFHTLEAITILSGFRSLKHRNFIMRQKTLSQLDWTALQEGEATRTAGSLTFRGWRYRLAWVSTRLNFC